MCARVRACVCVCVCVCGRPSLALAFSTLRTNGICIHYISMVITIQSNLIIIVENNGINPLGPKDPVQIGMDRIHGKSSLRSFPTQ